MLIELSKIKYVAEVYPRSETNNEIIKAYELNLDKLPPIVLTTDYTLIDGYHRYLAHRDKGILEIEAEIRDIPQDKYLYEAIKLNATHGYQLTREDKVRNACNLYKTGISTEEIAELLAVSKETIQSWTREIREAQSKELDKQIMDLYLACYTEEEIAEIHKVDRTTITKRINVEKRKIAEIHKTSPESVNFYNLVNFQSADKRYGREYPGRMPGQIVENILWYFTNLWDIVLDPMSGGGTTIDVCKSMYRRYQAYDLKADPQKRIQENDIMQGVIYKKSFRPNLILLDPPYWQQKKGEYSQSPNDLANMELEQFYQATEKIIKECKSILADNGYLAFIIGITKTQTDYYDHPFQITKILEKHLTYKLRFIIPYTTQQYQAYDLARAKKENLPLPLFRDLFIYSK